MRSFDRPSAASGSGRSTPGTRKVPTGRLMAFVSLLRRGRLAGRFPRELAASRRFLSRRVPAPACLRGWSPMRKPLSARQAPTLPPFAGVHPGFQW